jgi:hypothetical protein
MPTTIPPAERYSNLLETTEQYLFSRTVPLLHDSTSTPEQRLYSNTIHNRLNDPGHIPFPFPPYPYWAILAAAAAAAAVRTAVVAVGTAIAVVVDGVLVPAIHSAFETLVHSTLVLVLVPVRTPAPALDPFAAAPDSSVGTD